MTDPLKHVRHRWFTNAIQSDFKLQLLSLAACCQIYRVTEEAQVAETAVWPIPFLMICSVLLKELSFKFYFKKHTRITCPCNVYHSTFIIVKLGYTGIQGIHFFFLIFDP